MNRAVLTFWLLVLTMNTVAPAAAAGLPGGLEPAAGRLLVAQRSQYGPYFARSVVYLLQHDADGSVGLVLNRPLNKRVEELLPELRNHKLGNFPVYFGGPVSIRVMVMLFRGNYDSELALHVDADIYASSNVGMMGQLMLENKPQTELRLFAGQANWNPGQLQQELEQDSWFVIRADPELLFAADTARLWERLINALDPAGIIVRSSDSDLTATVQASLAALPVTH